MNGGNYMKKNSFSIMKKAFKVAPGLITIYYVLNFFLGLLDIVSKLLLRNMYDSLDKYMLGDNSFLIIVISIAAYTFYKFAFSGMLKNIGPQYMRILVSSVLDKHFVKQIMIKSISKRQEFYLDENEYLKFERAISGSEQFKEMMVNFTYFVLSFGTYFIYIYLIAQVNIIIIPYIFVTTLIYVPMKISVSKKAFDNNQLKIDRMRHINKFTDYLVNKNTARELKMYNTSSSVFDIGYKELDKVVSSDFKTKMRTNIVNSLVDYYSTLVTYGSFALIVYLSTVDNISVGTAMMIWTMTQTLVLRTPYIVDYFSKYIFGSKLEMDNYMTFVFDEDETDLPDIKNINEIELSDVSFKYPGNDDNTISNINLKISKGETICILGYNGSGKTTLSKLITGMYHPSSGQVKIGSKDIKSIKRKSVYNKIGFMFQDFAKMQFTFKENIMLGSDNELAYQNVLSDGSLKAILSKLDNNENTTLGVNFDPGGSDLSLGEWQRIMYARLKFKDNQFMILDEPTASLDPLIEEKIITELYRAFEDKTVIVISHRIGFASLADRIILVSDGQIVEDGSHNDLLQKGGLYSKYYNSQLELYS